MVPVPAGLFQTVPTSVWEQVGIVALLFVVVVPGIFAAVRWLLNDQRKAQLESQQALLKQQQDFIAEQNKSWQKSIAEGNTRWQSWLAEQNTTNKATLEHVTEALRDLGKKIDDHDKHVDDRVADIYRAGQQKPARKTKSEEG